MGLHEPSGAPCNWISSCDWWAERGASALHLVLRGYVRVCAVLYHLVSHQALIGQDPPSFNRARFNRVLLIGWSPQGGSPDPLKLIILIIFGGLLGVSSPWRHA